MNTPLMSRTPKQKHLKEEGANGHYNQWENAETKPSMQKLMLNLYSALIYALVGSLKPLFNLQIKVKVTYKTTVLPF